MSTIATYIRDAIMVRLKAADIMQWGSVRTSPFPTLQPDQLPALGVYLMRENYSSDGDGNVGPPRYIVDAVISISVTNLQSDPNALDTSVDNAVNDIEETLLCDGTFIDLRDLNNKPIIDSIPNITRTFQFPQNGETYYLECRLQMTFRFMCYFEPRAPNWFKTASVEVTSLENTVSSGQASLEITLPEGNPPLPEGT